MKLIVLQENLKRGLNISGHITTRNINLPILNNILIRAEKGNIELVSTNLEIGIVQQLRGKIERDGQFTVDSKLIGEYVNLLNSGEKVEIEEEGGELKVECGRYKTKIKGESAKEFPLIPLINQDDYYTCDPAELKAAAESVIFATSTSENRQELTGVLFFFSGKKLVLAATDSYRLAEKEISLSGNKGDEELKVIVPGRTVQELLRILGGVENGLEGEREVKIRLTDNQIQFSVDSVDLISRLISGNYPDYRQIIPTTSETKVIVSRSEMVRAVKAAALFSKSGINDVTIQFRKKKVIISSFSGSSGESQIEVEAEVEGGDNEITINYRYLVDGLSNIAGDLAAAEMLNSATPFILKGRGDDSYLYIVMPIRQ